MIRTLCQMYADIDIDIYFFHPANNTKQSHIVVVFCWRNYVQELAVYSKSLTCFTLVWFIPSSLRTG